jgi:DNA-binding response OmpR family regulator
VLLAENSALLAARLREAIKQPPAVDLVDVVNGETAAAREMNTPDLLVLDLELSDGSSFGVLRHLRAKKAST